MKICKKFSMAIGILLLVMVMPSLGDPYEDCYHNCEVTHNYPYEYFNWTKDDRSLIECRGKCDKDFPLAAQATKDKRQAKRDNWKKWCFWCR